jgi:uncharacterized membrane protein
VGEGLTFVSTRAIVVIEAMALLNIVIGTGQAFFAGLWTMLNPKTTGQQTRHVWIRYARWLVAGLTFQLAAGIIKTAVAPDWEDIGRLAAIAVIRTFLDFFLERDLGEARERRWSRTNPR